MADKKISELTNITGSTIADTDEFVVVDASANETKAITASELRTAIGNGDFTVTGNLTVQGTTITVDSASAQNIVLGDNDKMTFGAGSDLQIYHDGSNSYIKDAGQGNLYITATDLRLGNADNSKDYLRANDGGAVSLLYNAGVKLATTATGVDITGTLTSDGLTVEQSGNDVSIVSRNTSNNASVATSSSLKLGITSTVGTHDSEIKVVENAVNSNTTRMEFYNYFGGTLYKNMSILGNGDISFYEDTGTTAKFFWDASAESLTLGASSEPSVAAGELNLVGVSTTNNTAQASLSFFDGGSNDLATVKSYRGGSFSDGELAFEVAQGGAAPAEAMRIDSSGNVGIGISNPFYNLVVSSGGASGIEFAPAYSGTANLVQHYSRSGAVYVDAVNEAAQHRFNIGGSEKMRIDSSGNVGIGTSSPSAALEIVSTTSIAGARLSTSAGSDSEIEFINTSSGNHTWAIGQDFSNSNAFSIAYNNAVGASLSSNAKVVITSSGFVGIGTTSPARPFSAVATGNTTSVFERTDGTYVLEMKGNGTTTGAALGMATNDMVVAAGGSERMRITSSGNVGIGTTANVSLTSSEQGFWYQANDWLAVSRSAGTVAYLNRLTSDGNILDLRKDGATVGSIGANGSRPYLVNPTYGGIRIDDYRLNPATTAGANWDNALDLGAGGTRWKDLYLSGGVYLGGTGSANKLDDYEEGTWTPDIGQGASGGTFNHRQGFYTKVGRVVHFEFDISPTGWTADGNHFYISGLPFTSLSTAYAYGGGFINYQTQFLSDALTGEVAFHVGSGQTLLKLYYADGNAFPGNAATVNQRLIVSGRYFTN